MFSASVEPHTLKETKNLYKSRKNDVFFSVLFALFLDIVAAIRWYKFACIRTHH